MVSMQGYNETYDIKHFYDITDKRSDINKTTLNKGSVMHFLMTTHGFSKMAYLLRLSQLDRKANDPRYNMTLFVARDSDITLSEDILRNLDLYSARQLVLYATCPKVFSMAFLRGSPIMYIDPMTPSSRILIENINTQTEVNRLKLIKGDIMCTNGVVHILEDLLLPDDFSIQDPVY